MLRQLVLCHRKSLAAFCVCKFTASLLPSSELTENGFWCHTNILSRQNLDKGYFFFPPFDILTANTVFLSLLYLSFFRLLKED